MGFSNLGFGELGFCVLGFGDMVGNHLCVCVIDGRCPKGWLLQQEVICVGLLCNVISSVASVHH